jgi:hypothetical protein
MLIYALLQTIELWIFLGILGSALLVEELVKYMRARNERKQIEINLEIDRLHQ